MRRKMFFVLTCLLIGSFLIAAQGCGGAPPAGGGQSSSALPAEIETPTPLPTDTPTPIPTPTNTPTPPPTPTLPELFEQEGFEESPPFVPQGTQIGAASVEDSGTFAKEASGEFVTWFTMSLTSDLEISGFRVELQEPELLINLLIGAISAVGEEGRGNLSGLDGIGDEVNGVTLVTKLNETPMRMNLVIFQRGNVGAVVAVVHIDGLQPTVSVQDVARRLDEKIMSEN